MDIARVSLDIASLCRPTWSGTCTHVAGSTTLVDPSLARASEEFAGGTLWALGLSPVVYAVKAQNNKVIELETVPTKWNIAVPPILVPAAITNYIISAIPFALLLQTINNALVSEFEMTTENIVIDTVLLPTAYTPLDAVDVRKVEIVPTVGLSTSHHYWREVAGKIEFYKNEPTEAGNIRLHYPTEIQTKTQQSDILPSNLRAQRFIQNCVLAYLRVNIQKLGKDAPTNYDLIKDAVDISDRLMYKGYSPATTTMDYDVRYKA